MCNIHIDMCALNNPSYTKDNSLEDSLVYIRSQLNMVRSP